MNKLMKGILSGLLALVTVSGAVAQVSLLPAEPIPFTVGSKGASTIEVVDVSGQPFKKSYRMSTLNQGGSARFIVRYTIDSTVRKGDILLLSFYTRSIQSKKETGESFMEIALDRFIDGKYNWPPLLERGMSFGSQWTLTQIPFTAGRDVAKREMALLIKCGQFPQLFELGAISLLNYKQSVKLKDLPRSVVHYEGDAPDAAWRKGAADRIEQFRKGDLRVRVLDKKGEPVSGASVTVNQTKSAFAWGTATSSAMLLDTLNPTFKTYRDTLRRYFNKIVFENEMKSKNWGKADHNQTKRAVDWLRTHDIPARGHVMVWPSWQHSPQLVPFREDKQALRAAIFEQIADETAVMKGQFVEWDVINEPYAHHALMDSLGGKEIMIDWFAAARKNLPDVKLFLNEYTMFHEGAASDDFFSNVKFLTENKAPIDGIGEQAHIGGTPPGMAYILAKLDKFGAFGLPIQISEFDITSDDDAFKARYLRDFMTAIFSHPAMVGFMQWGFWEGAHWIPAAALWDKNWTIRSHGRVFTELVGKTWITREKGVTAKAGAYNVRGFTGDYDIVVTVNGKSVRKKYTLDRKGGTVDIRVDDGK